MAQALASCPASQWDRVLSTNSCPPGKAHSGIPILDQADVCQVLSRTASSTIGLSQRAPGIWSLAANNSIALNTDGERLRLMFGNSLSTLALTQILTVAGGRTSSGAGDKGRKILSTLPKAIPGAGESFMRLDGDISHSEVPIVILNASELRQVSIAVDTLDSNDYEVRLYSDPTGTPALVQSILTLSAGNISASATGLTIAMAADDYGLTIARTSGSGGSTFKNISVLTFIVEN